jgi:hypothetical protein
MSIPRGARCKTLQKYFSHPSLVIYFFLNPTHKTKTRMQIGGNHLHQLDQASRFIQARLLTHLPSQKRSPILKNEAISRKAKYKMFPCLFAPWKPSTCYPLCPPDNLQNSRVAESFTIWTSIVGFSNTAPN